MERYVGPVDVFFRIEGMYRKEELEGKRHEEAKHGWSFAADAGRVTDGGTGEEHDKRMTGGCFFVAFMSDLGAGELYSRNT